MRFSIIFMLLTVLCSPLAAVADDAGFATFMKSREVVATLYFGANSDSLPESERVRIDETMAELRQLQKQGRLIRVEGFSSPEGNKENNFQLSFFRARSVADLIESKGLPAEVTLTGYGDLLAKSSDPLQERRVEIAAYIKPTGLKKVKVVDEKTSPAPVAEPRVGQSNAAAVPAIDSLTVDQAIKNKLADKKQLADQNKPAPVQPNGLSQLFDPDGPVIDALLIEQAIMEKIGAVSPEPSGALSQVDKDY